MWKKQAKKSVEVVPCAQGMVIYWLKTGTKRKENKIHVWDTNFLLSLTPVQKVFHSERLRCQ